MKIAKKEVVTGVLIPFIAITLSIANSSNWLFTTLFASLLISFIIWIWIEIREKSILTICIFLLFVITGCLIYNYNSKINGIAEFEIEPIQLISNDSMYSVYNKLKSSEANFSENPTDLKINKEKVNLVFKKYKLLLKKNKTTISNQLNASSRIENYTHNWGIKKEIFPQENDSFNRDNMDHFFSLDTLEYMRLVYNEHHVWNIFRKDEYQYHQDKFPEYFPIITCTIRNIGENSGTLYGLSSKIICIIPGVSAQGCYPLKPLNKEFRLYLGKELIFENPILFEKNSVGTIKFSPTFRKKDIYLITTPPQILFSISAIFFDGIEKKTILLGYYRMYVATMD